MNRRSYLVAAGASVSALLAGCMGGDDNDPTEEPGQSVTTTDPEEAGSTTDRPGTTPTGSREQTTTAESTDDAALDEQSALPVVDDYVAAATDRDLDALARTMHSAHPFNPENLSEEELESVDFESRRAEAYERELADTAFGTGDEGGAETIEQLIMLTEDGEWRVFWPYSQRETLPNLTYLTAPFDPSGDEVVVTITVDGEETVVYREEYSPG